MVFVIDDDELMAECLANIVKNGTSEVMTFRNAVDAMNCIADGVLPDLIFLDVLLDGPDGFTLMNDLVSYPDTVKIPIVIVSSLDFANRDLSEYGVVGILSKETMTPEDIENYVNKHAK